MSKVLVASLCACLVAVLAGCSGPKTSESQAEPEAEPKHASATIEAKNDSGLTGTAVFTPRDGEIMLQLEIENTAPGRHAAHIHETGDCSAADGTSAGGHWNPTGVDHGKWAMDPFHLGDLGNLTVGDDGTGAFIMTTDAWSIGTGEPNDIVGKAIIIHEGADDFTTQPTGGAGGRIGCGVIR